MTSTSTYLNTMFFGMLLVAPWLLPPPAGARTVSPGPISTIALPQTKTAEDSPITPVPTYALATFDSRLSSLSAARTAYPGCTFVEEASQKPTKQPLRVTDVNSQVSRAETESSRFNLKGGNAASRRTRPVQPTIFEA
ncbi:hypothetical protein F5144DRAFT_570694, partial [Chaetomium tenue]